LAESIQFQTICSIPSLSGFSLVTTAVAEDQSLLFLLVEVSGSSSVVETVQHGVGIFLRAKTEVPKRFCLQRMSGGSLRSIDLPLLDVTFPRVDTFPDGRILLASPRCSWRAQYDYDLNGIIFDPGTGRSRRMLLGDGVDSMQIDRLGRIWVSYVDEGISAISAGEFQDRRRSAQAGWRAFLRLAKSSGNFQRVRATTLRIATRSTCQAQKLPSSSTRTFQSAGSARTIA
jgi:hypothetical protein